MDYTGVKLIKIEKSTLLNCGVEKLFDFHIDSNNIKKITPKDTKVDLLNANTKTYEGKIVKIKTRKFFITTHWEVKIEKLKKPEILIDIALKSPFKYWKHQHIFMKIEDNKSELKDIIEFDLPFYAGFLKAFIIKDIENKFDFRHKITKRILEET